MRDPQTRGARMTHRGLAVASPYGMSDKVQRRVQFFAGSGLRENRAVFE